MKQLLILSGKGGTGKTTIAGAFIQLLQAKAYADCDVDAPNLHLIMQNLPTPQNQPYYGLDKAIIDQALCIRCGLCFHACQFNAIEQINGHYQVGEFGCEGCGVCHYVCPTGAIKMQTSRDGELQLFQNNDMVFSTAQLKMGSGNSGLLVSEVKKRLSDAAKEVEIAIIDGSPGIGCPVIASLSGVDLVLIVTEPSLSGISDLKRIVQTAAQFKTPIAVCINKYDTNLTNSRYIEDYCLASKITFVGCIPYDEQVVHLVNSGRTIIEGKGPSKEAVIKVFQHTMQVLQQA